MEETSKNNPFSRISHLSILSNPDGFVFFDADSPGYSVCELKLEATVDFPEKFEDIVNTHNWSGKHFLKVSLTEHSDHFLILPTEINDPAQQRQFFDTVYTSGCVGELMSNPLSDGKQLFCCEIPSHRLNSYKRLFPTLHLYNNANMLTEWVMRQSVQHHRTTLLVYRFGKSLQLFVANQTQLVFANSFIAKTSSDATYFCLRCIEQLNLDPFETHCIVCSGTKSGDELADSLRPYLKHIEQSIFTGLPDNPLHPLS